MFGVEPGYRDRFLTQRQAKLASFWNCDPKTVQRRCEETLRIMAGHLAEHAEPPEDIERDEDAFAPDTWYTERMSVILRLDKGQPEAIEERTIVSRVDRLSKIVAGFGVPRPRSVDEDKDMGLDVELVYGARLVSVRQPSGEYIMHYMTFPREVSQGDKHTYVRIARIPHGQTMVSRYVFSPLHRCDTLDLRVRFDERRIPEMIWRVSGVPAQMATEGNMNGQLLEADSFGELRATFTSLRPGLSYGILWRAP